MQPHCTSPHGLARQRCWTSNTASVQDSESELQAQTQFNVLTCFGWGPHPQSLFCHCTLPRKAFTRKRRSCGPLERNVQVRKSFSRLSRGSRGTVFFLACELQGSRVCFLIFSQFVCRSVEICSFEASLWVLAQALPSSVGDPRWSAHDDAMTD